MVARVFKSNLCPCTCSLQSSFSIAACKSAVWYVQEWQIFLYMSIFYTMHVFSPSSDSMCPWCITSSIVTWIICIFTVICPVMLSCNISPGISQINGLTSVIIAYFDIVPLKSIEISGHDSMILTAVKQWSWP